jgi:hypothetical protein
VHDPEHEDDSVDVDRVEHHPVVADPKTVERIASSSDRLDRLAAADAPVAEIACELLEGASDPVSKLGRNVPECLDGGWTEFDPEGSQARSSRGVVWPLA